jgi:FkbM family methyltransferase
MSWRLLALRGLGAYLRRVPEHRGRWRLIASAVALAPELRTLKTPRVIRSRDGLLLEVDGSSQTGRILFATGEYEPDTTRVIRGLLSPGQVMIDVGANIGYFSMVGARAVGAQGRVVAFEPAAGVRDALQKNLRLNAIGNVEVRDEALAARSGTIEFFTGPEHDTGLASLRELPGSARTLVKQVRFDEIWQSDKPVTLIKIDVEGAETAVLEGMERCLARDSPHLIVEVTDEYLRGMGSSAASLVTLLQRHGYSMFRIDADRLRPVASVERLIDCPSQFNALFTKAADVSRLIG